MKSASLAFRIVISVGLLVGCGGGGGGGENQGAVKECSELRCTLGNCRIACIATGPEDTCCSDPACSGDPICGFTGGTFSFSVTAISQDPGSCLVDQSLMDSTLLPLIQTTSYDVILPPLSGYPAQIVLQIPRFEPITVTARLVNNQLVFDTVLIQGIDLGQFDIPGLNCLVGGTASGGTSELNPDSVQVTIHVSNMTVATGSGTGTCVLQAPQICTLDVVSEGIPVP